MLKSLILLFTTFLILGMTAKFPEDVITWSENRTLKFNDFKGEYNKEANRHNKKHGLALIRHTIRVTTKSVQDTL